MAKARTVLFRIFYSTTFTSLFLLTVCIIGISPADKMYESYKRGRLVDIFLDTGAYVITALVALFLYAARLYSNRSVLRDIPKNYLPIEKEELPRRGIHRLIENCMSRSAVIAYHAKPRARRIEVEVPDAGNRILVLTKQAKEHHHHHDLTEHEKMLLAPQWGVVKHPGWQSPASQQMSGIEYASVLNELMDLIEAKAVSLAPEDPLATPDEDGTRPQNQRIVDSLTRPGITGMRQYLAYLTELGVLPEHDLTQLFVTSYERARYGATPLDETEFQSLMRVFAELLRSMTAPDAALLEDEEYDVGGDGYETESPELPMHTAMETPFPTSPPSTVLKTWTGPDGGDTKRHRRMSEDSVPSLSESERESQSRTAPKHRRSQRSTSRPKLGSRYASAHSQKSRPSLRQVRSQSSGISRQSERSQSSVIRLARPDEEANTNLPYVLQRIER